MKKVSDFNRYSFMLRALFNIMLCLVFLIGLNPIYAQDVITKRIPEFSNDKVNVWKTVIYPTSKAKLKMHRHDYDRVVIALTDGLLKIINDKGQIHYLELSKGKSYYLQKDPVNELHTDENLSKHPISVVVVELK